MIVELVRLFDSAPFRQAMVDHPAIDLAVLLSGQLHRYVVAEEHPGIPPDRFTPVEVDNKQYRDTDWLWESRSDGAS
jgi:hypothetical protein